MNPGRSSSGNRHCQTSRSVSAVTSDSQPAGVRCAPVHTPRSSSEPTAASLSHPCWGMSAQCPSQRPPVPERNTVSIDGGCPALLREMVPDRCSFLSICSKPCFYFRCCVVVVLASGSSMDVVLRTLHRVLGLQVHSQSPGPQPPLGLQTHTSLNELSASPLHWALLTLCVLLSKAFQPHVSLNGLPRWLRV